MRRRFLWLFVCAFGMIFCAQKLFAENALYNAKGKRDPFVQLVASSSKSTAGGLLNVETMEEVMVEGVVMDTDPKNSIVVANGSVLKEGDEVGSVKVLKISADGALFSVNGIEEFKALYQGDTKKNATS